jgi:hypothetical protein
VVSKTLVLLAIALFIAGIIWIGTHPLAPPSTPSPSTVPDGASVEVPIIAFDQGNKGNPVAGVQFTALIGGNPAGTVVTTAGVVPPNMTLIAGQLYTFRVNAYGTGYSVNMVMSDVQGASIVIYVNSVDRTITDVFFTYPVPQ